MEYKSSNGNTYVLVKSYIKMGNHEKRPIYFFKKPESIRKKIHFITDLPEGWGVVENPKNGYPLVCGVITKKQVCKAVDRAIEEISKPDVAKFIEEELKKVSKQNETKK